MSTILSIFIASRGGESKCYGFGNFVTHEAARKVLVAAEQRCIVLSDRRGVEWTLKAEWAHGGPSMLRRARKAAKDRKAQAAQRLDVPMPSMQ